MCRSMAEPTNSSSSSSTDSASEVELLLISESRELLMVGMFELLTVSDPVCISGLGPLLQNDNECRCVVFYIITLPWHVRKNSLVCLRICVTFKKLCSSF